jgi:hypothetical protein
MRTLGIIGSFNPHSNLCASSSPGSSLQR